MGIFKYKFVLDANILLDFLLERENYKEVSKVIEYLVKNKNGFISSSSLSTLYYVVFKYKRKIFPFLPKILKNFIIWKTPSYINWNHPLAQKDIEDYLIHLTAESLNAFVITPDEEFLKFSDRAITIEEFFEIIQNKNNENVPFLDLSPQNIRFFSEVEHKIDRIINTSHFICGKYVKEFEDRFAEYLGAKFCIGVNSGTSALIVALMAIGLKPGDEVIIPVNTFIATAEAISILGGKPVFIDIHPEYYTIEVTQIEDKITDRTKAIIPVHLYGQCADMDPIMEIARKYNFWVIEDACQAHGAEYKGRKAGTIGHIGCFSFYPSKNLGAWGEAGAVVTNDKELAEKIKKIRNHGSRMKYYHEVVGGNFRMSEIQGAVLSTKIKFLDEWNDMRRRATKLYNKLLNKIENIAIPYEAPYNKHVYHLYVIRVNNRDKIKEYLQKHGIETGIHYPIPLHLQKAYKALGVNEGCYPVAEKVADEILSLPIFPYIKEEEIDYVVEKLKKVAICQIN